MTADGAQDLVTETDRCSGELVVLLEGVVGIQFAIVGTMSSDPAPQLPLQPNEFLLNLRERNVERWIVPVRQTMCAQVHLCGRCSGPTTEADRRSRRSGIRRRIDARCETLELLGAEPKEVISTVVGTVY